MLAVKQFYIKKNYSMYFLCILLFYTNKFSGHLTFQEAPILPSVKG